MSQENVETVRASVDAFQHGEFETALSYFSKGAVWHPLVAGPYHGRAGVAKQMEVWVEEFDGYWFQVDELIDAGDEVVLLWRHGGKGTTSGVQVEDEGATVFTVEAGHIHRARVYSDRAEALDAAGLRK